MTWTSSLPLGLLKRIRTFTLSPQAGLTHLTVKEEVSGPLVTPLGKCLPGTAQTLNDYFGAVTKRAELLDRSSLNPPGPSVRWNSVQRYTESEIGVSYCGSRNSWPPNSSAPTAPHHRAERSSYVTEMSHRWTPPVRAPSQDRQVGACEGMGTSIASRSMQRLLHGSGGVAHAHDSDFGTSLAVLSFVRARRSTRQHLGQPRRTLVERRRLCGAF